MLHVILRYGSVALIAATLTALFFRTTERGAEQTCFENLTLQDGILHAGSSELIFSGEAGLIKIVIENDAPNQLMGFFATPEDGPAEIRSEIVGQMFSVCKTNASFEVSG